MCLQRAKYRAGNFHPNTNWGQSSLSLPPSFHILLNRVSESHSPTVFQFWKSKLTGLHCIIVSAKFLLTKVGRAFLIDLFLYTATCMNIYPWCISLGFSNVAHTVAGAYIIRYLVLTVCVLFLLALSNNSPHCYAFFQMYQRKQPD